MISLASSSFQDVAENQYEKRLLYDDIRTFKTTGALEKVKETLKELVMLLLQRPELFAQSQLTKYSYSYVRACLK